ncbi:MAG: MFS transporter [Parachlamydiales bacterium]|jgi:MFS family permease
MVSLENSPTVSKKQKRQFWVILVIVFLGFIGISMPYLIFPVLFLNPDYSIIHPSWDYSYKAIFLGITLAAYPLGQFIGSPILGSLSDDYGRKNILAGSLIISALFNLITGLAITFEMIGLLIFSRFMVGLMEGNIAIARALATDLTTISKHEAFGKINAMSSIAFLLGPLIGGLMTDQSVVEGLTASTPFYCICVLFLGLAVLSGLVLDHSNITAKEIRSFWQRINLFKRLSQLFANKYLQFLMITSTCFTLAVDILYEFGPVYLTVKWDLTPSELVIYNGVLCLTLAAGNGWLPQYLSDKVSNRTAIIYSMGAFALCLMGIVWTDSSFLMTLFFAISGLFIGLAITLITVKISNSVSDSIQGEVMGVQVSLRVLGDAVICLLGGVLLLLSPKIILVAAAGMSIFAMGYYIFRRAH